MPVVPGTGIVPGTCNGEHDEAGASYKAKDTTVRISCIVTEVVERTAASPCGKTHNIIRFHQYYLL